MKKLFLFCAMIFSMGLGFAQNGNIVIFSEGGERFTAILNGERMNNAAATNVKVTDLNQPGYKLKVIFEDRNLGEISKDIMVAMGEEAVYMIKLDKKGEYKVAWRSSTPIASAPTAPSSQVVYHWGAPAPAPAPAMTTTTTTTVPATTVVVEETVVTTTTTGTPTNTTTGESVSMNVNVPGFGMNVNVNTTGTNTNTNTNTTVGSTSTVMTTTTTTTASQPVQQQQVVQPVATSTPCAMMDNSSFDNARNSIKSKSFEDSKMTLAKQITKNNCLSAAQVKSIMELFSFEESKLEYAKFAFGYCYEQNNYYIVNDAFDFESSIEELDSYISSQR